MLGRGRHRRGPTYYYCFVLFMLCLLVLLPKTIILFLLLLLLLLLLLPLITITIIHRRGSVEPKRGLVNLQFIFSTNSVSCHKAIADHCPKQ